MVCKPAVLAFFLLPAAASAQAVSADVGSNGATAQTAPAAQQSKGALPTFQAMLAAGHDYYAKGDFQGALTAYEGAKSLLPQESVAYYFIGCAQAKLAKYDDAVVALKTACTLANEKDSSLCAKALFAIGVVEEMRWNLEAAKEAWSAYREFARTHKVEHTFSPAAESRLAAVEKMRSLEEQYAVVRARIESGK